MRCKDSLTCDCRSRMSQGILSENNLVIKRLWNLDTRARENTALDTKTKKMRGLVVQAKSGMLRCGGYIKYSL